jgi:hypothetical protein
LIILGTYMYRYYFSMIYVFYAISLLYTYTYFMTCV